MARSPVVAVGLLLAACPSRSQDPPRPVAPASAAVPQTSKQPPAQSPPLVTTAEVTHLEPRPARASADCKPLAPGPADMTRKIAQAIRTLACEPELYYLPVAEVERRLELPEGMKLHFNGPRSVELNVTARPSAAALARVAGIKKPVVTTAKEGAWAVRSWYLGANATTGDLDIWGPGHALVGVNHDREPRDSVGTIKPLKAEVLNGWISITMPPDVVVVKDDGPAVEMLRRAAEALAADPQLLGKEPDAVAQAVGVNNPRFRVSRRSVGTGPGAVLGIDVWSARTQISAESALAALGIQGSIEPSKAHDSDDFVLADDDGERAWRGLRVALGFEPRQGTKKRESDHAKDFVLDRLTLMPGALGGKSPSAAPVAAQRLEITAAQARQHGLAPRRIALDLGASGMSGSILNEPGRYFHLSGPPGGPLGLELREQAARPERELVASIRANHRIDEKDLSKVGTIEIQGKPWRVIAFVAGEGFSRSIHWVADRDGLTLHAFVDWRDKPLPADAIARLTATRPFDHLLRTLEIE